MQRIKVTFSYDGTFFSGFQRQRNVERTVQQVFEDVFRETFDETITLHASGRTDAGVHALAQVAHFDLKRSIPIDRMVYALNRRFPPDLVLVEAKETSTTFHARKSALGKSYSYYIYNGSIPPAVGHPYVVHIPQGLDEDLFKAVLQGVLGTHCFRGFCGRGSGVQTFERTVLSAVLIRQGNLWQVQLIGDGFLRKMVRNIVGTALDIAAHRKPLHILENALQTGRRCEAGRTAPAKGLFLERVFYEKDALREAVQGAGVDSVMHSSTLFWKMPML